MLYSIQTAFHDRNEVYKIKITIIVYGLQVINTRMLFKGVNLYQYNEDKKNISLFANQHKIAILFYHIKVC